MTPIHNLSENDAVDISCVFSDIDDTLTLDGRLLAESFDALWRLKDAGIRVIPVTGRPAGWCDCILREWPVDAIVGENGAFCWYHADDRVVEMIHPEASGSMEERLSSLGDVVLERFPGARLSRDQRYRIYDLAIDFREDVDLNLDTAHEIASLCREMGAVAKVSSIHVNAWFGDYDKLDMVRRFLDRLGYDEHRMHREVCFCGDSPNDEPMFSFFPNSVGVANISEMTSHMRFLPTYITSKSHGLGFAEFVDVLLGKRSKYPEDYG